MGANLIKKYQIMLFQNVGKSQKKVGVAEVLDYKNYVVFSSEIN